MQLFFEVGVSQLNKNNEELCGDSVEVARTRRSTIIIVSDGLGSGVKANILSSLTTKMAATMLKKGSDVDEVIETLAGTLPVCKVRQLAYSTFTILKLDHDGTAYVAEYDNPGIIAGRDTRLIGLGLRERQVGSRVIREATFKAQPGDWLVVVSDGVLHAGIGGVWNLGWGFDRVSGYVQRLAASGLTAEEIAQNITSLCNKLYGSMPGDDTTCVAVRVRQPRELVMLVGPPKDKADDTKVVQKLLRSSGAKVVCGGTTANLVARALGQQISVDLDSCEVDIPPTGTLDGVDLVTEGMLTMVRTLEYLRQNVPPSWLLGRRDGASRLTHALLLADKIQVIVGRAINPAHQSPDVPAALALKSQIVDDVIRELRRRQKKVAVEYF